MAKLRRGFGKEAQRFGMNDRELIDALCDVEDGLRSGELRFIDDVGKQMSKGIISGLSPDQRKWAEDIWERVGT